MEVKEDNRTVLLAGQHQSREERIAELPLWGQEFCRRWGIADGDIEILMEESGESDTEEVVIYE